MKRIGEDLGFAQTLTTYAARHSFAAILIRSGAPMKLTVSIGHVNVSTTEKNFAGYYLEVQVEI